MKYSIVDFSNLVHRAKYVVSSYDTIDDAVGLVLTIVFGSIRKTYEKFDSQHCVACFDHDSWRSTLYPEYKKNRRKPMTPEEAENRAIVVQVLNDVEVFLREKTNVTVLKSEDMEADDFVARWIQNHPHDEHVIISSDSDFKQLVTNSVELYNPVSSTLFTMDGVFIQDGTRVGRKTPTATKYGEVWKIKFNKKTQAPETFDPDWELFYKCIRGDATDNIKQAFPKVRETRMRTAYEDRGGLEWNNLLNETWGPEDAKQSVKKRYEFNQLLIDLTAQPDVVKETLDEEIDIQLSRPRRHHVGVQFAKFCGQFNLPRLRQQSSVFGQILSRSYIDNK